MKTIACYAKIMVLSLKGFHVTMLVHLTSVVQNLYYSNHHKYTFILYTFAIVDDHIYPI
jgi:hypothetical protein